MNNEKYFLIHMWVPKAFSYVLLTEEELSSLHRTFGRPSFGDSQKLLCKAAETDLGQKIMETLEKVSNCELCERVAAVHRRFSLPIWTENLHFNRTVQVDTMFKYARLVTVMVDKATHFRTAYFLSNQPTKMYGEQFNAFGFPCVCDHQII